MRDVVLEHLGRPSMLPVDTLLQEMDLSMDYAHKGKDAANAFRFTPCIDAVRPGDAAFEGLDALGCVRVVAS